MPTGTPLPAGGLRIGVGAEPAMPSVGEPVEWVVTIDNVAPASSGELLLEVTLPAVLVVEGIEVTLGETARDGRAVRWYVRDLGSGSTAVFRARGVAGRATTPLAPDRGCVLLVSRGAPVEFCGRFDASETRARSDQPAAPEPPPLPTAPTGLGLSDTVPPPRTALGLSILVIGLGVLGAWIGTVLRGARRRPTPTPELVEPGAHESERE